MCLKKAECLPPGRAELPAFCYLPTAKLPYGVTWMWNLKYDTNELIYKIETDSQITERRLWLPKGKGGGVGIN